MKPEKYRTLSKTTAKPQYITVPYKLCMNGYKILRSLAPKGGKGFGVWFYDVKPKVIYCKGNPWKCLQTAKYTCNAYGAKCTALSWWLGQMGKDPGPAGNIMLWSTISKGNYATKLVKNCGMAVAIKT